MGILDKILSGGAADIINSVGGVIDNLTTTNAEKEQLKIELTKVLQDHQQKMAEQANIELQTQLADIQSARSMNTSIQESEKSTWLSKNFAYFLDGAFCILFAVMLTLIFKREVPVNNKELFYTGFGLLGGIVSTIVNFHRGSSRGSEKSNDAIRTIAKGSN